MNSSCLTLFAIASIGMREVGKGMNEESGASKNSSRRALVVALVALVVVLVGASVAYSAVGSQGAGVSVQVPASSAASTSACASSSVSAPGAADAETGASWGVPEMTELAMDDSDGYPITLGDVADGKLTVINVWATWCPFCVDEMPDYQKLYDKYGDKVSFVMLDSAQDSAEVAEAHDYVEKNGFTFPVYYDSAQEVSGYFRVSALPTTIVIAANGDILNNRPGRINLEGMDASLAELAS